MNRDYAIFYIEGRDERLIKHDVDTEKLAEQVLDDKGTIHECLLKAVGSAAEPLRIGRRKREWIEDHKVDIDKAGGDEDAAYDHYLQGRIDELVAKLEADVADDLASIVTGDDGEEDDESEGGDDDENEDDEED